MSVAAVELQQQAPMGSCCLDQLDQWNCVLSATTLQISLEAYDESILEMIDSLSHVFCDPTCDLCCPRGLKVTWLPGVPGVFLISTSTSAVVLMRAKDGYVVKSKYPEYSYEGFEEFPVPGHNSMNQDEKDRWSTRMTKNLRHGTPHPHMKDLPSVMEEILHSGEKALAIEEVREILGGNHHFRVRRGEGDEVVMMIVTEGPDQRMCVKCAEEERWHGAAKLRQKSQPRGSRHRHGLNTSNASPAARVDYSKLFPTQPDGMGKGAASS